MMMLSLLTVKIVSDLSLAMTKRCDQGNVQKKVFPFGLRFPELEFITIRVGMTAGRHDVSTLAENLHLGLQSCSREGCCTVSLETVHGGTPLPPRPHTLYSQTSLSAEDEVFKYMSVGSHYYSHHQMDPLFVRACG